MELDDHSPDMIDRVAKTLAGALRGYRTADMILIEARQSEDSLRRTAHEVVMALREPTCAMVRAAADSLGNEEVWRTMIDAVLAEKF